MTKMRHHGKRLGSGRLCLKLPIGGEASLPGPGRKEGRGQMPTLGCHRVGSAAAQACGSDGHGCACICEVVRCSGCQGSWVDCGKG